MPKQKTNSSAKKRLRLTGTGKIKRKQVGMRHNLRKKSTKTKRALGYSSLVTDADTRRMKVLLNK